MRSVNRRKTAWETKQCVLVGWDLEHVWSEKYDTQLHLNSETITVKPQYIISTLLLEEQNNVCRFAASCVETQKLKRCSLRCDDDPSHVGIGRPVQTVDGGGSRRSSATNR